MPLKLIVGLGNPGPEYAHTRHNIGFQCLAALARAHRLAFGRSAARSRLAEGEIAGHRVVLARPQTFMNHSGDAVRPLLQRYRLSLSDLLVICDDLDLPLGKLRLRPEGGSGGHKGLDSIIAALGTKAFPRLRVGIGRPLEPGADPMDYVLADFTDEEEKVMGQARPRVVEAVQAILSQGLEAAMNQFNR